MMTDDKKEARGRMSKKTFTDSYIEESLSLTLTDAGAPLDRKFSYSDIDTETLAEMKKDCSIFYEKNGDSWGDDEKAGRNFWLSRNGHGRGFFDDDDLSPPDRKKLHDLAKKFGTFDLYVGDDEETIYGSPLHGRKNGSEVGLRSATIRLAHAKPELRPVLLPLLRAAADATPKEHKALIKKLKMK